MKKIIYILLATFLSTNLQANLISSSFVQSDIRILEKLDINSNYLRNKELQDHYNKYLKNHKKYYIKKLNEAQLIIPQVKKILKKNEIPDVFLFLAMAESYFILEARSYKRAAGIWQFMPGTSKMYGLNIDKFVDERLDIIKSTQAASDYLNMLHKMFDKWYLAAMAYNCGEGRVIEAITRATIDMYCVENECKKNKTIQKYRSTIKRYQEKRGKFNSVYKIYKIVKKWDYKPGINEMLIVQDKLDRQYLPRESRIYIRKIISLAMMNNHEYIKNGENNHLLNRGISSSIVPVEVKGGTLLQNIADVIDVGKKELKYLNPHVRRNIIPINKDMYTIYIPYAKLSLFNENIKDIKKDIFEYHIVKSGDNLGTIARKYGIGYGIIKEFNKLKNNNLRIKQHLLIPLDPDLYAKYKKNKKIKKTKKFTSKTRKNKKKNTRISKNSVQYHIVKNGDSLSTIGNKYGMGYGIIKEVNSLTSNKLKLNQRLIIPNTSKIKTKKYFVKNGDTLIAISRNFNVPLNKIMKDNKLKSAMIQIGDKIVIKYN